MSEPRPRRAFATTAVVVVCIVAAFCFTLACVTAIVIAVPEGANQGSLATILLAAFSSLVPSLLVLAKVQDVGRTVDDLANGKGDAKFKAAARAALAEHEAERQP